MRPIRDASGCSTNEPARCSAAAAPRGVTPVLELSTLAGIQGGEPLSISTDALFVRQPAGCEALDLLAALQRRRGIAGNLLLEARQPFAGEHVARIFFQRSHQQRSRL